MKSSGERKEKLRKWLKDPYNLAFLGLIAFTILFRLYYFFLLKDQPIWWDEGDYLAIAKVWATGQSTPEWWSHFTGMRPLFIPLLWAGLFKIGFSELMIRFVTELVPSILVVYFTYRLGTELYDRRTGLIAGLIMSVYWVFVFYSFRLLTDIPATLFGLLSFYFFWKYYIKENKPLGLYLCIFFGVLAFSTRFPLALVPVTCAIYLLFTRKFKVFTDKTIWKSVGLLLICLIPYIIFFIQTKFYFLQFYFGSKAVTIKQPIALYVFTLIPQLLHSSIFILMLVGILTFFSLFISLDLVWKQKDKSLNSDLFVTLWILVHLVFYVIIIRGATDRWILMLMPALFFLSAKGLVLIYELVKKYNKIAGLAVFVILLGAGFYQQANHSHELIIQKKDTYKEVKLAGEWLKENTSPETKVITSSIVQNQYYSDRQSYDFHTNDTIWEKCSDLYGSLSKNTTCQEETEKTFDKKIAELKPKYLIVSVFEPVFTPQWAYTYPDKHNLTAVQGYLDSQNNPVLIIYEL